MIVCGIDYSLTSPAVCFHRGESWSFKNCTFHFRNDGKKLQSHPPQFIHTMPLDWTSQEQRHRQSAQWVCKLFHEVAFPDLVVLEGYAFASKGLVFNIAENTGCLKQMMFEEKVRFMTPTPSQIKKMATEKGNAKKDLMEEAFDKETGYAKQLRLDINQPKGENPSSDIIDSYYLAKFGFLALRADR